MQSRHFSIQEGKSLPASKFIWVVALLLSGHGSEQELPPQSPSLAPGVGGDAVLQQTVVLPLVWRTGSLKCLPVLHNPSAAALGHALNFCPSQACNRGC